MKRLLRYFLINLISLWATSQIIPGLTYSGGIKSLLMGALIFTLLNLILVPLLRILLLPLNLLTVGLFAWTANVVALYALTTASNFQLVPYFFSGFNFSGFIIPSVNLSTFMVAILASLVIGLITHLLQWLIH